MALTLVTYILVAFVIRLDWKEIFYATLIPHIDLSAAFLLNIVAILGTTISPYLFFWQASEEVEEEIVNGRISDMGAKRPCATREGIVEMNRDTGIGMFFSQVIMFFIIVTTAATLHTGGITTIQTASQAAEALRPLAGDLAYLLFAVGIIGTGLLALSTLIGMSLDWFGINPITALYYAAALNGLVAPPLMALIIRIANRKDVMGQFVNSRASNVLGWVIVLVMALTGAALIVNLAMGL